MFLCAISGEAPTEPVVSVKSHKVYEKRLIMKYIADNGTDPTTGEKLEESDLIPIEASPDTAAPRPPSHTSIPTLLLSLQNEWDALVLETFALKQQYNQTRQELSYALYSQDAATRVVARLIKERDAAREALASVQASMGVAPSASTEDDVEMGDTAAPALPQDVTAKIEALQNSLSATRKKRKPPAGYITAAKLKTFTAKKTIPSLHSASPAGITALAVSKQNPSQFLTGGNDKIVQLYDGDTDKVLATLKGHTKKVNHVAFREADGEPTLLISGGADKVAKIWSLDTASGEYIPKSTIRTHKGEITGLVVHPTTTYLALSSADKTYSIHDLSTFDELFHSSTEDVFASLAIHPDGQLLAMGTPSSTIRIFDIRTGTIAASLTPPDTTPFTVHSVSFSENGYHLMAPLTSSSVGVWDLRKAASSAAIAATISLEDDFNINRVVYDASSQYLGVAGSGGGRVFAHKTWDELLRLEEGKDEMTQLVFGNMGQEIWGSTGREVRVWGLAT